jgi:CubicO group peptidase (beta-lactamase class C family)
MHFDKIESNDDFTEINQHVLETKNLISASAASTFIIQNDCIVNEWYSGYHQNTTNSRLVDAESRFNVASIRKTYLGLAVSLAINEGKIKSLNDWITDYLDDLDEDVLSSTTIRHLLTHTHGLQGQNKRIFPPGTDWKYNNAGVNLLIRIIQKVFEQPLARVVEERVFLPYGFTKTGWIKENNEKLVCLNETYLGNQAGEANLFVSTRELAYWGYLHLTRGKWKGQQIIPSSVFDQAVSIATPSNLDECLPRNGFFWWVQDKPQPKSELGNQIPTGSFQSLGLYGNVCLVIPDYRVVAVRMLNQSEPNPPEFDYIKDIQGFGNKVCKCILKRRHSNGEPLIEFFS